MDHPIAYGLGCASEDLQRRTAEKIVDATLEKVRPEVISAVETFLANPISPAVFFAFEVAVLGLTREMGRCLVELVINALEPANAEQLPRDLWFECGGYRRGNRKTRNGYVATLFGTVTLWRRGYRGWQTSDGTIFPLEMFLGLNHGATPALVDWLGRKMAEAGPRRRRQCKA